MNLFARHAGIPWGTLAACAFLMLATDLRSGVHAAPRDPPSPQVLDEARRIVQEMVADPRGPYSRIRWFCNDGSIQPPVAYACREHGGGRQHAEYSAKRERLVALGYSVGTIFAALTTTELEGSLRHQRLRELALERYMIDIDNGWVLRRAKAYRGRVQIEDEEAAGRGILLELLADTEFVSREFLLLREAVRVMPHGRESGLSRRARRGAVELAELDASAEPLRAEIHGHPGEDVSERLRRWLADRERPEVRQVASQLLDDLDRLYGASGRRDRMSEALADLPRAGAGAAWRETVEATLEASPLARVTGLCSALVAARTGVLPELSPSGRLALLDAMQELETEATLAFRQLSGDAFLSRRDTLLLVGALLECGHGSGLLSATELQSVRQRLPGPTTDELTLGEYRRLVTRLRRTPTWAMGTVRHTFAEALARYTALDGRAARFADDLLRGSPFAMFGDALRVLVADADRLAGSVVEIDGRQAPAAIALNAGAAQGPLRVFATLEDLASASIAATDIVVVPETVAELSRVAGILTLGEGNALSHVQLLARNFGIPNVAVDLETLDRLRPLDGQVVQLVVASRGDVVLVPLAADPADDEAGAVEGASGEAERSDILRVPAPDLEADAVLRLADMHRGLSGRVIGPKAANLGELARMFRGRVAPAVALPFGIYASHLRRAGLSEEIASAFAARDAGGMDEAGLANVLASVRQRVAGLELDAATRDELLAVMREEFGEGREYGVFVRSDTNVEDLPRFTGAGLNETVPNVVGTANQLGAIPRVWSSVLSPRAIAWRAGVLENPAEIYASVLLMESLPATKSGVLVTANLFDRSVPGLTVSVAWGVGGAVAGEAAESVVISADDVERIHEAKAPYQRRLAPAGGVDLVPAPAGPVLTAAEIARLRELAVAVGERYEPVIDERTGTPRPWDIEFGFVDGELTLFQIRPLVEKTAESADRLMARLRPESAMGTDDALAVSLADPPAGVSL